MWYGAALRVYGVCFGMSVVRVIYLLKLLYVY